MISWLMQKSCHWLELILLGMRERYVEYEIPTEGTNGVQSGADGRRY